MTNDRQTSSTEEDAFVQRTRTLFDESVAALDGRTRSELNRRRHEALAAAGGRRAALRPMTWLPLSGAAAAVVVAVLLVGNEGPVSSNLPAPAADMDMLLEGDDLDMLDDLEFYSWIDLGPETAAHVG